MIFTRDKKVRSGAAVVLAGMFAAGIAVGVAVDRRAPASVRAEGEARQPDRDSSPPNNRIIDRLEMTPEQRARVDSVVAEYGRRMSELQREYRPRFHEMVDSANSALRESLTEEQRVRYDSIRAAAERRRDRGDSQGRR